MTDSVPADGPPRATRRPRGLWRVAARIGTAVVATSVLAVAGTFWSVEQTFMDSAHVLPASAFTNMAWRPDTVATPSKPLTVLLLGSNLIAHNKVGNQAPGPQADMIQLIRFDNIHDTIDVLSIPDDAEVTTPTGVRGLNTLLAWGPGMVAQYVEKLTGVTIQHVLVINFTGLRELTIQLGGISVLNPKASTDPLTGEHFSRGEIEVQGERALTYVRQILSLPGGVLGRIAREQQLLAGFTADLQERHLLTHPSELRSVTKTIAGNMTIDSGLTLPVITELVTDIVSTSRKNINFYVAPLAGDTTSVAFNVIMAPLNLAAAKAAGLALAAGRPVPLPETKVPYPTGP